MTDINNEKGKGSGNGTLVAVISLLSAVSVAVISHSDKVATFLNILLNPTTPTATITAPKDQSQVPIETNFEGTVKSLPKGASLWLYVYPSGAKNTI